MLIIEGSDCLGKTTAIDKIRKMVKDWNPPILYGHMSKPNVNRFDFCQGYKHHICPFKIQDRFHLGALVWHRGHMNSGKLWSVEKRLKAAGAFTVIFFTSDYDWYRDQLKKDERGNLYSEDAMFAANIVYRGMVTGIAYPAPVVDYALDIRNGKWPDEETLIEIVDRWKQRLETTQWKTILTTDR